MKFKKTGAEQTTITRDVKDIVEKKEDPDCA